MDLDEYLLGLLRTKPFAIRYDRNISTEERIRCVDHNQFANAASFLYSLRINLNRHLPITTGQHEFRGKRSFSMILGLTFKIFYYH